MILFTYENIQATYEDTYEYCVNIYTMLQEIIYT